MQKAPCLPLAQLIVMLLSHALMFSATTRAALQQPMTLQHNQQQQQTAV
jgi:hypothetical protein